MSKRFPSLLNDWIDQQEKAVNQQARNESEGDIEVYRSIYHSEMSLIDYYYNEEQLFYQAMLIMVYFYYDSILLRIATEEEESVEGRPSCIAYKYKVRLNCEYFKISEYIHYAILPLRNQLYHNSSLDKVYGKANPTINCRKRTVLPRALKEQDE